MTAPDDRRTYLADHLAEVRDRLSRACAAADRAPDSVTLLPVTKFFPASDVVLLRELGCTEFGESREQDASPKVAEIGTDGVRWHMIGRLQRNKAKAVAAWAHAIHSVDTDRLVTALGKAVAGAVDNGDRTADLDVYVQVSLDGDTHRGGVDREDLEALTAQVSETSGLRLAGLMAVPPLGADADASFEDLQRLHTQVLASHPGATGLSAGMTGDLEEAVRHGSTCVRVGTAILGPRPITSP
ncbi:YggS family pyridoxal phosphate-dependent enzyme [Rhodococcus sp. NBC_00294]|uniref:YggS family pyridoxal phosphate-dependent enzyme n=1 Tax=Rhodococcus sp. NBC_00294 TaxID=2976004 RepID=UPI002E2E0E43|nr:YggS family pyridoxal phosphate-dependent enzyme [Rhodococcus sp. NBC_00294]